MLSNYSKLVIENYNIKQKRFIFVFWMDSKRMCNLGYKIIFLLEETEKQNLRIPQCYS